MSFCAEKTSDSPYMYLMLDIPPSPLYKVMDCYHDKYNGPKMHAAMYFCWLIGLEFSQDFTAESMLFSLELFMNV